MVTEDMRAGRRRPSAKKEESEKEAAIALPTRSLVSCSSSNGTSQELEGFGCRSIALADKSTRSPLPFSHTNRQAAWCCSKAGFSHS